MRAVLYYLMKNPASLAKAHAEIDAALAAGTLNSPIRYSDTTTKLPYVCAVIKEAMRMTPSVGLSMPRYAPEGGIEVAGMLIPCGYRIGMNAATCHYRRDAFGQDADDFRPERWLVGADEWKAMDKSLLTFGAGTRTCIGKNVGAPNPHVSFQP
jgi:cytochrome P450